MAKYEYKSEETELLKKIRTSLTFKKKHKWSRKVGSGFIAEDLRSVTLNPDGSIGVITEAFVLQQKLNEFNLRETEELLRFVENREAIQITKIKVYIAKAGEELQKAKCNIDKCPEKECKEHFDSEFEHVDNHIDLALYYLQEAISVKE